MMFRKFDVFEFSRSKSIYIKMTCFRPLRLLQCGNHSNQLHTVGTYQYSVYCVIVYISIQRRVINTAQMIVRLWLHSIRLVLFYFKLGHVEFWLILYTKNVCLTLTHFFPWFQTSTPCRSQLKQAPSNIHTVFT